MLVVGGVGPGVGVGVALGSGLGVAVAVGSGLGVGDAVGLGVGVGEGFGVGRGTAYIEVDNPTDTSRATKSLEFFIEFSRREGSFLESHLHYSPPRYFDQQFF